MCNSRRVMTTLIGGLLATGLFLAVTVRQADARPQYFKMWIGQYPSVATKNDVKDTVKCNVCHYGTSKKNRNEYGKALQKALAPKKNVKDKEVFDEALKTIEKEKSATSGKTFGDLLNADELPAKKAAE
jgi:hypothetical protein